ncbi:hypothetical protein GM3708_157 [Geminocystis sp. NIES-3708]|uniref:VWA domain-containing protein n=1 Tax=Geminocystis sp. NIES-3708 TaxID=1615909 RepID=UPI0005FCA80B|nr:VWA domain-containing protein [Geminocystis sp. NIES-3708]BAQ59752.1 hypothetical protein GM3708_157 [Geminocystis sp. NIES-3708]
MNRKFLLTILVLMGIPFFLTIQKITSKAETTSFTNDFLKCENEQCFSVKNQTLSSKSIANNTTIDKPKIEIAILLDSSNSMDGLIEQTRTQIWKVINAISDVTKNEEKPIFRVSLYHYGNNSLPSVEGFQRMLNELTTDLDVVSEKLFSIQTNGGQEYSGWVIDSATKELQWSDNPDDFRVIFIAGNEPFDQGSMDWQKAINSAVKKDILVNTIYCGLAENSESDLWVKAADMGKGNFFNINQDQEFVNIPSPHDKQITDLNQSLNQTYIPYGNQGNIGYARQQQQDMNAISSPNSEAVLNRAVTKTTSNYRNSNWDLVDAFTDGVTDLKAIDNNSLPENMRGMTTEEKIKYIQTMKEEREKISKQIAELSQKRDDYIRKNLPQSFQENTLDILMIETLKKQLSAKGFIVK